jgi:hypothetical protein
MRTVELTPARFAVPSDFNAERYLEGAWGILRGDLVAVRVVFARTLKPYIRERLWHRRRSCVTCRMGGWSWTLLVADTLEVRRWVLVFGGQAEVIPRCD